MTANIKIAIFNQLNEFTADHYDAETKRWYTGKNEDGSFDYCTPEGTKVFQARRRELKFAIQMLQEEENVKAVITQNQHPTYKKFMPLVSRRLHLDFWSHLGANGKTLQDGNLFTFKPINIFNDLFCGCTDSQLVNEIKSMDGIPSYLGEYEDYVKNLRQQHTLRLQKIHNTGAECSNPFTEINEVFQNKHTIGNWDCRACLTAGQEIVDSTSAVAAMSAGKAIEWCPRFLPLLRGMPILEYVETLHPSRNISSLENNLCYAGLLHSEISFTEEEKKQFVIITKKCDTCGFEEVEKKEYFQPEEIKNNEPLVNLDGE